MEDGGWRSEADFEASGGVAGEHGRLQAHIWRLFCRHNSELLVPHTRLRPQNTSNQVLKRTYVAAQFN